MKDMSTEVELGLSCGHLTSWPSWVAGSSSGLRQALVLPQLWWRMPRRDLGGGEAPVQDRAGMSVPWFSQSPFVKHCLLFLCGMGIESDTHARGIQSMFGKGSQSRTKIPN